MTERSKSWEKYGQLLFKATNDLGSTHLNKLIGQASMRLSTAIKKNIQEGGIPGGKPFKPLAMSTIEAKGSTKPLIDHGDLMGSVTARKIDHETWFVGIPGDAKSKDPKAAGVSVVTYARVHEYGAIIDMPDGRIVVIDERPFMGPIVEKRRKPLTEWIAKKMQEWMDDNAR